MKFTGVITAVGIIRSGRSAAGNAWESQTFVIEEEVERAPMSIAFDVWDRNKYQFNKGEKCTVHLEVKANEGKEGRYYNNIQVWRKEGGNTEQATPTPIQTKVDAMPAAVAAVQPSQTPVVADDDLPF